MLALKYSKRTSRYGVTFSYIAMALLAVVFVIMLAGRPAQEPALEVETAVGIPKPAGFKYHPLLSTVVGAVGVDSVVIKLLEASKRSRMWIVQARSAVNAQCRRGYSPCDWLGRNLPGYGEDGDGITTIDNQLLTMINKMHPSLFLDGNLTVARQVVATPRRAPGIIDPRMCLRGLGPRNGILLVGHSHVRFISSMLCVMLGGSNCHIIGDKRRIVSQVRFYDNDGNSSSFGPIVYVQARYNSTKAIPHIMNMIGPAIANISHVVYGRGVWDLIYRDIAPRVLSSEVQSELRALINAIPTIKKVTLYLSHYQHLYWNATKPTVWLNHIAACKTLERQVRYRNAVRCAGMKLRSAILKGRSGPEINLFDVWEEARDEFAALAADAAGHHYMDVVLEGFVQKLLGESFCPSSNTTMDVSHEGEMCDDLLPTNHREWTMKEECGCHWPQNRQVKKCSELAGHLARVPAF